MLYPIEPSQLGIDGCLFELLDDIPGIGNGFGLERPHGGRYVVDSTEK
jgi:hypothetical protein